MHTYIYIYMCRERERSIAGYIRILINMYTYTPWKRIYIYIYQKTALLINMIRIAPNMLILCRMIDMVCSNIVIRSKHPE